MDLWNIISPLTYLYCKDLADYTLFVVRLYISIAIPPTNVISGVFDILVWFLGGLTADDTEKLYCRWKLCMRNSCDNYISVCKVLFYEQDESVWK